MRKHIVNKVNFRCLTPSLTPVKIRNLQEFLTKEQSLEKERALADLLSGEVRFKIIFLLSREGYLSVGDIADILKSKASGISHQLSILRKNNLVRTKKKERVVFYYLAEKLPSLVKTAIGLG